jgi:hypothetical protein
MITSASSVEFPEALLSPLILVFTFFSRVFELKTITDTLSVIRTAAPASNERNMYCLTSHNMKLLEKKPAMLNTKGGEIMRQTILPKMNMTDVMISMVVMWVIKL